MKRSVLFLSLAILVCMTFAGCKSRFHAPPPAYSTPLPEYKPSPSVISMPVSLPFDLINREINKQMFGLIYKDEDFDGPTQDNLKVKVWRTEKDIRVDGQNGKLRFRIPLEIWAEYRWKACSICPAVEKSTEFNLDLTLVSSVQVDKDWKLRTSTTATEFTFSRKPYLDFGVVDVDITSIVKTALKENMSSITSAIDDEVPSMIPLRDYMENAWKEMQTPILMDSAYQAWLILKPNYIMMQPLVFDSKKVTLNAGIETFIETQLGEKPRTGKTLPLASPYIKDKIDKVFTLEVPVTIDFKFATELARRNLKDSVFTVSKKKQVKIDDIEIYGKGGDVFIKAMLSGNFEGLVYLRGKPSIDTVKNVIYFADLDFDINTKNGLLKIADWLAHGTLKKILQKEFTYAVGADLNAAKATLQEFLNGFDYEGIFTVKGKMGQLHLKYIYSNEECIKAIFITNGTAAIDLTGFGTSAAPPK